MKNVTFYIVYLGAIAAVFSSVGFAETGDSILAEIQRIEELMQPSTGQPTTGQPTAGTSEPSNWKNETYGSFFYAKKPSTSDTFKKDKKTFGLDINHSEFGGSLSTLFDYTYRRQLKVINDLQYQFSLAKAEVTVSEQNEARFSPSGISIQANTLLHSPSLETKIVFHKPDWGLNVGVYQHTTYQAVKMKVQSTIASEEENKALQIIGSEEIQPKIGNINYASSVEFVHLHLMIFELGVVTEIKDVALKKWINKTQLRAEPNLMLKLAYNKQHVLTFNKKESWFFLRGVLGAKFAVDFLLPQAKNLSIIMPLQLTYVFGLGEFIEQSGQHVTAFRNTESDFRIGLLIEADLTRSISLIAGYEFQYIITGLDIQEDTFGYFKRDGLMVHNFRLHLNVEF